MKKKRNIILIIVLVIVAVLVGILITNSLKNLLTDEIRTVKINDINRQSNSGELSTIANGKIYYYSNEQDGINGIYQMDLDGSNVELLIESPNIRRLTAFENKLYYVGLFDLYNEKQGDSWDKYGIYESDDFSSSYRIAPELSSIYDAFFYENGYIIANDAYENRLGTYEGNMYQIANKEVVNINEDEFVEKEYYITNNGYTCESKIKIFSSSSNKVSAYFVFYNNDQDDEKIVVNSLGLRFQDNSMEFPYTFGNSEYYDRNYKASNELYVFDANRIYIVDLSQQVLNSKINVELDEYTDKENYHHFFQVFTAQDDKIYAEVETKNENNRFHKRHALIISKEDGNYKELIEYKSKDNYILYFDESTIISLENDKIVKYTHDNAKINDKQELAGVKDNKFLIVDVAGDWLFVYEGVRKGIQTTLLYKINFVTNEVIKNTMPFDSTQHDEIHIDEDAPEYNN